jgi:hypothetical protein
MAPSPPPAGPTRTIARLAAIGTILAALATAAPSPALAGTNHCAWIGSAGSGNVHTQQICGVSGTYHMDVWGGGRSGTTGDYHYNGGTWNFYWNWHLPSGTTVCTQLWYHKPGGGYESNGLPCHTM